MNARPCLPTAITSIAIVTLCAAGHATTVVVSARDGNDVGSGATNAANSGAWTDPSGFTKPPHEVNGVLTTITSGAGNGPTPQTYTYNVTDSVSGVNFDFQTTFTAYASNGPGGTWIPANKRGQTSVDSSGQESRERTEFLTAGGYSEYARTAFVPGSIVVNTPGFAVSFLNWDSVKMTSLTTSVVGEIRISGDTDAPGTVSLATFLGTDGAVQIPALATSSATSIDWVPTAGDQGTASNTGGFGFQSKGFIMNFEVGPLLTEGPMLTIDPSDSGLVFTWDSQPGKLYDLLSDTALTADSATWSPYDDGVNPVWENIPASETDTTSVTCAPLGSTRLFVVTEKDPPPVILLDEDFDADDGGFTAVNHATGTIWALGDPESISEGGTVSTGNGGTGNCWGTDITNPGFYETDTDTSLISPVMDLTGAASATLSFAQAIDIFAGDTLVVNIIEADISGGVTKIGDPIHTSSPDGDIIAADWETIDSIAIGGAALGQEVRIEWRFTGSNDAEATYMGGYIDDVLVTATGS